MKAIRSGVINRRRGDEHSRISPFVDTVDTTLRSFLQDPHQVALEEQAGSATWTRGPFRAGVERRDLSARAWVGLDGHLAREFFEPLTTESAQQLGAEFAALLPILMRMSELGVPAATLDVL